MQSKKKFAADFYKLLELLEKRTPFAFNRFSDGELAILQDKEVVIDEKFVKVGATEGVGIFTKEDYKKFNPIDHKYYREKLVEAFRYRHEHYYKGLSCRCCVGDENFEWQLKFHGEYDENLTWANLLINGNYFRFLNEMLPLFNKYKSVLICNRKAKLDNLGFFHKDFRVGYNAMINDYALIDQIKDWMTTESIKGHLFLFSASTFSKLAIHQLYQFNDQNTYIDIGTAINPLIGMRVDRGYLGEFWGGQKSGDLYKNCIWDKQK
jgi:hypothetical protein